MAANIFVALDAYWDSDRAWIDEMREHDDEHLKTLVAVNEGCIQAMDHDPEHYWEWREQNGLFNPRPGSRKPLSEVRAICEKALRTIKFVLDERKR